VTSGRALDLSSLHHHPLCSCGRFQALGAPTARPSRPGARTAPTSSSLHPPALATSVTDMCASFSPPRFLAPLPLFSSFLWSAVLTTRNVRGRFSDDMKGFESTIGYKHWTNKPAERDAAVRFSFPISFHLLLPISHLSTDHPKHATDAARL